MQDFREVERKWQRKWEEARLFEANVDPKKKKFFITIPYPYLNGEPHLGSAFTWLRGDTYARFKRMQGYNVLFPQGFHATGEPILGVVERLSKGDKDQIEALKVYGITDKDIENFVKLGPSFVAKFWMRRWIELLKSAGISIDWRRTFMTALDETYNKFIEWQYRKLREKGYVVQGTHPVVWCPYDQSPTGDHDRLKGEGESPIEYTIIKFKLDSGEIIPCATLRPETAYGATNVWINPSVKYVWAEVNGEVWLLSEKAAEKIKDQLYKVSIIGRVDGEKLVARSVTNPVTRNKIVILPANFVDPTMGTGIVMSVPAHAPYDFIALSDLQKDFTTLARFKIDKKTVEAIRPISIISVEGFGDYPAVEISTKMMIQNQMDKEKLEKATSEIYKKEYHTGTLKENTIDYAGKKVADVKESIIKDFVSRKIANIMWELTGEVVCRCKTVNHVKILQNQWFLKFSDEKWKKKVKTCVGSMKFFPEDARLQFLNTVDWLKDKACTRKSGLGTKLPWDKDWIIETLSDSTIYMAYYTIARIINDNKIPAEKLNDSLFDYVFLGKGDVKKISKETGLKSGIIEEMKKEFEYFYPVDLRTSAKELIQNHLTFYLFHHVALWAKTNWPKSIGTSGFVNVAGMKMSKRFGNVIVFRDLLRKFGSDLTRMNLISSNEDLDDADWKEDGMHPFKERLDFIINVVTKLKECSKKEENNIELFLKSRLQSTIQKSTEHLENMKFRSASQEIFFSAINDLQWYIGRCASMKNCNGNVLRNYIDDLLRLISPFAPHFTEEVWSALGNKGFAVAQKWPKPDKRLVNRKSELAENAVKQIVDDVRQIEKIRNMKAKDVTIIVAADWKFSINKKLGGMKDKSLKEIFAAIKTKDKDEASYIQNSYKKIKELPAAELSKKDQIEILKEAKSFFENTLSARVKIETEEESQLEKKKSADVTKPAIFLSAE